MRDGETMVDAFSALGCPAVIGCLGQNDDLADSLLIDAFYRDAIFTNWVSLPASLQRAAHWFRRATWIECATRLSELYGDRRPARPPDSPLPYASPVTGRVTSVSAHEGIPQKPHEGRPHDPQTRLVALHIFTEKAGNTGTRQAVSMLPFPNVPSGDGSWVRRTPAWATAASIPARRSAEQGISAF